MPSPRSFSNSFHLWLNLSSFNSPGVSPKIQGGSRHHSQHLKTKEVFPLNLAPFSSRFMVLASCHPHNCFRLWEFFSPIQSILWVLSILFLGRPSFRAYSFSAFSSCSPNLTGESFKYPLISSWSHRSHVSKSPQVYSFVFQFFPVNCAFATFIFNSYGGSFKISLPLLLYQFIFFNPTVVRWRPSQV